MSDLKKHVIAEFSGKNAQKNYLRLAKEGFWISEKIIIEKYFPKKSKVLDIGCGTGRTTIPLHKMKYDVLGIDITPVMIKNAKKISKKQKLKIKYEINDATKLKFKNNSFDCAIFSNNGWTQIPDERERIKALKEIKRVLKKDGVFVFTTHNRTWFSKYFFYWLWLSMRFYVLKPLGFNISEIDFGDRFFNRAANEKIDFHTSQYIHIPSIKDVKKQIKKASLKLIFYDTDKNISKGKRNTDILFYVCKKS